MNRSEDRTTNQARLIPTRRRRHNGDDNTVKTSREDTETTKTSVWRGKTDHSFDSTR
jgi:hypothetical protein